LAPTDLPEGFGAGDEKVMVNVGSVGQPRDGDRRASYLIWEDGWYEFQRVSYEFQVTVEKVQNIPELGPLLGDRLKNAK
jgi:diadenosine tetraphosphatase ApaH/serine/threonine PP2A family protein phosphatase